MVKRLVLAGLILAVQFVVLEAGIRWHGGSEVAPAFQALFVRDPAIGHRLKPQATARFTTAEFSTDLRINAQGVRDDTDIGPKAPNERRIAVLGDSLVLSVQVPLAETFCERLEAKLNAAGGPTRWRVINAGVQGYGPVQAWFLFDKVIATLEPDVVLVTIFVGNDAIEADDTEAWLDAGRPLQAPVSEVSRWRELARSSVVLQIVRLRWELLRSRLRSAAPERPLTTYLSDPPPEVANGVAVTRRAVEKIAGRAAASGARTGVVLMPARFQTDDADYGRLRATVAAAGGELLRQAATERFRDGLRGLGLPMIDLLPVLAREPDRHELFFQRNVHLTRRGHDVVAGALLAFLEQSGLTAGAPR